MRGRLEMNQLRSAEGKHDLDGASPASRLWILFQRRLITFRHELKTKTSGPATASPRYQTTSALKLGAHANMHPTNNHQTATIIRIK
mmetsp:Transcript_10618/g.28106  ORF Transcript_10618/g.28106 Transcript_10618/m.28106 type:complete len:87 (+) Transcript_10618:472-732(+)